MEKKYCPFCKREHEVYPRGTFAVQLVDESRIVEYQCSKCGRKFRERIKKMKELLCIEGQFCHPDSNISPDIFYHDIYKKIDNSKVTKPIAHCNVFGKKKSIYLSELGNFFNDDIEYGTHFEGIVCISLTEKQIYRLSINGFEQDDIDLPEVLEVNINGIILNFFPYQYLY